MGLRLTLLSHLNIFLYKENVTMSVLMCGRLWQQQHPLVAGQPTVPGNNAHLPLLGQDLVQ